MLKQFRNFMRMLDELEEEDVAAPVPLHREPLTVELPHSVEPVTASVSLPAATVFVYDSDPAEAGSLADILTATGAQAETFTETESFVRGLLTRTPALVFLDVCGTGDGAIDALVAMGKRDYRGGVQLMGAEMSPLLDVVRHMGERHALQMLPSMRKPLDAAIVRQALIGQDLRLVPPRTVSLSEALTDEAIEFWYQPKIDLQRRQIAGVESFARIRHPEMGIVEPPVFIRSATPGDLANLSRRSLVAALNMVRNLSEVGIHLKISVNIPVRALIDVPVVDMVRELGPRHQKWPGLVLDVSAVQLAANFDLVASQAPELVASKVHLAIDDFNGNVLSIARLKELPVAEIKLDRSFVAGCDQDPARAQVCETMIKLAHHIGSAAIGVGVERTAEMRTLSAMGCDVGQGFLFGQPMPEQQLCDMLMKRAVSPEQQARSAVPAASQNLKRAVWH